MAQRRDLPEEGLATDLGELARRAGHGPHARRAMLGALGASAAAALLPRPAPAQQAPGARCTPFARETDGPFPADGSNSVEGRPLNVLTAMGIVRSDIRRSFGASTREAPGVPLRLEVRLVDSRGCEPLAGHAIYVWQADRAGEYSMYQGAARDENYLRGLQVADEDGRARFVTIFPPCYGGRFPHIHFEVYPDAGRATHHSGRRLTSQFAMPADVARRVYEGDTGYRGSARNLAGMSLSTDFVFRDNGAAELAAMTPRMTGDVAGGFDAVVEVAI